MYLISISGAEDSETDLVQIQKELKRLGRSLRDKRLGLSIITYGDRNGSQVLYDANNVDILGTDIVRTSAEEDLLGH